MTKPLAVEAGTQMKRLIDGKMSCQLSNHQPTAVKALFPTVLIPPNHFSEPHPITFHSKAYHP